MFKSWVMIVLYAAVVYGHANIKLNARRSMYSFGSKKGAQKVPEVVQKIPFVRSLKSVESLKAVKTVVVDAVIGNPYLDYSLKFKLPEKTTVGELKVFLNKKYPQHFPSFRGQSESEFVSGGSTTPTYPELYCDSVLLSDDSESLSTVWRSNEPMPLTLGVLFAAPVTVPTDRGDGTAPGALPVSDAIATHIALTVKQAYLSNKLAENSHAPPSGAGALDRPALYADMQRSLNSSFHTRHGAAIAAAVEREKDPEVLEGFDLAAVEREREYALATLPVLQRALAQFTSINSLEALQQQMYWSTMLWLFANYGTSSELSKNVLLGSIGVLWLSTLRSFRFLAKLARYTVLPWLSNVVPLSPLLSSASQTVLANFNGLEGMGQAAPVQLPSELPSSGDCDQDQSEDQGPAQSSPLTVAHPSNDDLESFFEYR